MDKESKKYYLLRDVGLFPSGLRGKHTLGFVIFEHMDYVMHVPIDKGLYDGIIEEIKPQRRLVFNKHTANYNNPDYHLLSDNQKKALELSFADEQIHPDFKVVFKHFEISQP